MEYDARLNLRLCRADLDELRAIANANGETLSERARELVLRGLANETAAQRLEHQGFEVRHASVA